MRGIPRTKGDIMKEKGVLAVETEQTTVNTDNNNKKPFMSGKKKDLIFYILMMAWPVLQFCVFYIGVNANSFLMAFQNLSISGKVMGWTFDHMVEAFRELLGLDGTIIFASAAKRSLQAYAVSLCIGTPLGLLFSYYIYKKLPFSGTFRVLLFMPSIISGIVMVAMFNFFVQDALPTIVNGLGGNMKLGLLSGRSPDNVKFATILFFNTWVGFGGGVLMYSNAMSGISKEVVDSAHLDGATGLREFFAITVPGIWPTLSTFLITGVAGIFSNQAGLFSFYGQDASPGIRTYGYEMYIRVYKYQNNMTEYPNISAIGLYMTAVAVPLTYLVKWLLEKFGPSED